MSFSNYAIYCAVILNSGGQEGLLPHVLDTAHTSKAQAMIDFGLHEKSFKVYAKKGESRLPDAMERMESFLAG